MDKTSPSHWQSVATILKQGVGYSTLPCAKLRAIVDAAREISRLYKEEQESDTLLGADDFLPIFIYSVVRAEMERPCALCKCFLKYNLDGVSSTSHIFQFSCYRRLVENTL